MATPAANALAAGLPDNFEVNTGSTWEYGAGLRGLYETGDKWAFGGGFAFRHRPANVVEGVDITIDTTYLNAVLSSVGQGAMTGSVTENVKNSIVDEFKGSMQDRINEYTLTALATRDLTETIQGTIYGDYTFDSAEKLSQNGSDVKFETGVRLNIRF